MKCPYAIASDAICNQPGLIDPADLLGLIEAAETNWDAEKILSAVKDRLDGDSSYLKKLAGE
jgi:hypothetical protein